MSALTIVGLTGQSGAGKTTVSDVFVREGFAAINCDEVAREVTAPDTLCTKELSELFPEFFDEAILNRRRAAEALFSDRELLDRYNAAIFPHIMCAVSDRISRLEEAGCRFILLDAPTLFESGADKFCSIIVSCVADRDVRLKRITERDGISAELAAKRFSSQLSEDFFRSRSDYVIENNSNKKAAEIAAKRITEQIKETNNGKT